MADRPARVTQSTLDVIEAFLDARDHELHGWAIIKATKRGGPTVYKILERLTEAGHLTARWEEQGPDDFGPRRRFYKLTPNGRAYARQLVAERRPYAARRLGPAFGGGA